MKQFSINVWVDILQDAENAIFFWWILLVKNMSLIYYVCMISTLEMTIKFCSVVRDSDILTSRFISIIL